MYRIAICDDELTVCSQIEMMVLAYAKKTSQEIEVDVYTSGEEMCRNMMEAVEYNLIFLDIELKALNGVEVGRIIREEMKDDIVHIIYISAVQGYAMELFEIRPINFLIKPLTEEKIAKNLAKSIELTECENQVFEFKVAKTFYKIPYKDIYYFVSEGKKVKIVTKNEIKEYYGKLNDSIEVLPEDEFFAIHKSYIVHYMYVTEYRYDCLKMINDQTLPISQAYRKEIRDKLLNQRKGRK